MLTTLVLGDWTSQDWSNEVVDEICNFQAQPSPQVSRRDEGHECFRTPYAGKTFIIVLVDDQDTASCIECWCSEKLEMVFTLITALSKAHTRNSANM